MSRRTATPRTSGAPTPRGVAEGGPVPFGPTAALVANFLALGIVALAAVLEAYHPDVYYEASQEDEMLEWATFWAFMLASVAFCVAARYQSKASRTFPWFQLGVALFCFVVAMEEISWGQRLLGFRPPEYFLAENFQQEVNFHNVASTDLRKLAVEVVLAGYGVLLPIVMLVGPIRRLLRRLGVIEPPWQMIPVFLVSLVVYHVYPWSFSGEWIEVLMGFGFLFAALAQATGLRTGATRSRLPLGGGTRAGMTVAAVWLLVVALGWLSAVALRRTRAEAAPGRLAQTELELEALRSDFRSGRVESKCNLHKRVYAFKEKYGQDYLMEGEYSRLADAGIPRVRTEFFIDPWNSPYWIRDRCRGDERVAFLYSFGPNRARDSDRWQILGDDIGVYVNGGS